MAGRSIRDYRLDARLTAGGKIQRQGGGTTLNVLLVLLLCCVVVPILEYPVKLGCAQQFPLLRSSEIVRKVLASERRGEPCGSPPSESVSISCLSPNMQPMGSLHYLGGFFGCKSGLAKHGTKVRIGEYRGILANFHGSSRQCSTFRQNGYVKKEI